MNQLKMSQGRTGKSSASPRRTETIVWYRYSYKVTTMVETNASTNENNKFYKINSAGHAYRRKRLRHKSSISVRPFC